MSRFGDWIRQRRAGRKPHQPVRETQPYPNLATLGQANPQSQRILYKPTPKNIRYFSRTPICRKAINTIKNPISQLEWEVVVKKGITGNPEHERQIKLVTACFEKPNNDDTFGTFTEQLVEDILVGAGAAEIGRSGDPIRPIWLWPVDGLSIQMYPGWAGGTHEARYFQTIGFGNFTGQAAQGINLRNDELMYVRPNPNTATPFGFGPVEIAFENISRSLSTGEFAGKLAGNALPPFMLDLGDVSNAVLETWRAYWRNQVEGQGEIPIVGTAITGPGEGGKTRAATAIRLYPEGDTALYLGYQEYLRTEIAAAFDLSNMALNIERDVNRSTAEVMEDRDWDSAIKPMATRVADRLNNDVVQGGFGFYEIEFRFVGLDREDEESTQKILCGYYDKNVFTANQIREKIGEPKDDGMWGDMTAADVEIAKNAARSAGLIEDPDLPQQSPPPTPAAPPGASPKPGAPKPSKPSAGKPKP